MIKIKRILISDSAILNKRANAGMTFVEVMVAVAVSLAFLSGVLAAFIQIIHTSDISSARLKAVNNARSALEIMSIDLKAARLKPPGLLQIFEGTDRTLAYGDGVDNDKDGKIDEEIFDGKDNDGDWSAGRDDRHQRLGDSYERSQWVNLPDLGDANVDEDTKFSRDTLTFRVWPEKQRIWARDDVITYEIVDDVNTYGESNVLVRRIKRTYAANYVEEDVSPIAFKVLSLDILYWNPNAERPGWVSEWDTFKSSKFTTSGIELPIAVYLAITVYAGTDDLSKYIPGNKIETITLYTIVNLEQVLNLPAWR